MTKIQTKLKTSEHRRNKYSKDSFSLKIATKSWKYIWKTNVKNKES